MCKKNMYVIAAKISGDFHNYLLGCKVVQSNFLFTKEGILQMSWKLL